MTLTLPNSIKWVDLQAFLADHNLVLVPNGGGNFAAIPNAIQRAAQLKAERDIIGVGGCGMNDLSDFAASIIVILCVLATGIVIP